MKCEVGGWVGRIQWPEDPSKFHSVENIELDQCCFNWSPQTAGEGGPHIYFKKFKGEIFDDSLKKN